MSFSCLFSSLRQTHRSVTPLRSKPSLSCQLQNYARTHAPETTLPRLRFRVVCLDNLYPATLSCTGNRRYAGDSAGLFPWHYLGFRARRRACVHTRWQNRLLWAKQYVGLHHPCVPPQREDLDTTQDPVFLRSLERYGARYGARWLLSPLHLKPTAQTGGHPG